MAESNATDIECTNSSEKIDKKHSLDSDEEEGDGANDCKKYEILAEDDIEGQEEGGTFHDGDIQITPFNMTEEMEEGHFDTDGMYHWNDEKEIRDSWLDNVNWVQVKPSETVAPKETKNNEQLEEESFNLKECYSKIIELMNEKETVASAIRRLGVGTSISVAERLKLKKAGKPIVTASAEQKESLSKLTEYANAILQETGNMDVYEETREHIRDIISGKRKNNSATDQLDMFSDAEASTSGTPAADQLDMFSDGEASTSGKRKHTPAADQLDMFSDAEASTSKKHCVGE